MRFSRWLIKNKKSRFFDFKKFIDESLVNEDLIKDKELKEIVGEILEVTEGDPYRIIGFLKGKNLLEDDPLGGYAVTAEGVAKIQELEKFNSKDFLFSLLKLVNILFKR